jgi:ribosomal protein S12 methylthiotransferase accessory factor
MDVEVSFPSSTLIRACSQGLTVEIGPPPDRGGDPEAYGPFNMLLCGLATCTGFMVLDFLVERKLPTAGAGLRIEAERSGDTHLLENVSIEIKVPSGFPDKYRDAIVRAAGRCPVKAQLGVTPEFKVSVGAEPEAAVT